MTGVRTTGIRVRADVGRARCTLHSGHLAARVLASDARGARVALVATGALLLGGDHVRIQASVGPGAWLDVVEVAGTVAFDAAGVPSSWHVRSDVGPGGVLRWAGLPFVVADGADVVRRCEVDLDDGARACLREVLVLGRAGERGGDLRSRTRITVGGSPLLVEDLDLSDPGRVPGIVGGKRVIDSLVAAGYRPDPPAGGCPAGDGVTRLDLEGAGTLARYLGAHTHSSPLDHSWIAWSRQARTALAGV